MSKGNSTEDLIKEPSHSAKNLCKILWSEDIQYALLLVVVAAICLIILQLILESAIVKRIEKHVPESIIQILVGMLSGGVMLGIIQATTKGEQKIGE